MVQNLNVASIYEPSPDSQWVSKLTPRPTYRKLAVNVPNNSEETSQKYELPAPDPTTLQATTPE